MLKVNDFFWAANTDPENKHAGENGMYIKNFHAARAIYLGNPIGKRLIYYKHFRAARA